jgi:hypothetical protein
MYICLVQLTQKHTEISGFFINYFKDSSIDVFHPHHKTSNYSCFQYYSNIFNKNLIYVNSLDESKYDIIFILSSEEINSLKVINKKKYILISHIEDLIQADYINISLTPLVKADEYILPIYNYVNKCEILKIPVNKKNIISIVGLTSTKQKSIGDLLNLIKRLSNYTIQIFSRVSNNNKIFLNQLENYKNVIVYRNSKCELLLDKIRTSKFICVLDHRNSWYVKDRLSGSIPLALNNEIPLILTKRINYIYNLRGTITYNESITEIFDKIININYNNLLKDFIECKNEILKINEN